MASRLGRVAFALTLPLVAVGVAVANVASSHRGLFAIVTAWLAAFAAAAIARRSLSWRSVREKLSPDSFSRASFVLPALSLSLVGPLTLHALVMVPVVLLGDRVETDAWFAFAGLGTVHVHVVFAIFMCLAAAKLARGARVDGSPADAGALDAKVPLYPAVLVSSIPGIVIVFPLVLVWLCGFIVSRMILLVAKGWAEAEVSERAVEVNER